MNINTIDLNDWDIEESDPIPKGDIPSNLDYESRDNHIGQTVRIKPNTRYWMENSIVNPRDTDGIITKFDSGYIRVKWGNRIENYNSYIPSDLIIV